MNIVEQILRELPEDASVLQIESTASDLESMNYEPMLLLDTPGFLRITKAALGIELDRVLKYSVTVVSTEIKSKQIELLCYYYALLCRLRLSEPAAWDTINELYEDD